jgi:EAL domain-containing protein (putative c-di-GMP-specific phosphodiesterase class I)
VRITASVGIAYAGPGERISDQLVGDADLAMYRAKRRGGSAHALAEPAGARALGAASAGQVAAVPATGQLYRPVVSTRDGACTELRMERTAVAGSRRRERAADGAGRWWPALEAGLTERAAWPLGRAGGPVGLSVTVPVRRLASAGFPRRLGELLVATATDPAHLVLELPAPTAAEAAGGIAGVLDELRALGVGSVLAGIGSGTWSFEALRLLPADSLELDPCLVAGIGRSPRGEALVTAVGGLVHALGRRLAAAGVATRQQHEVLAAAGCERAHGPLHGSAVPASQVSALLRGRSSRNSAPGPLGAGVAAR